MKTTNKFYIIGIILIVLLILMFYKPKQATGENKFMDFEMYDENMNPITPKNTLSIVNGNEGVFYLKFKMTAINTGKQTLSCKPADVSISEATGLGYSNPIIIFRSPITTQQIITSLKKYTWSSDIVQASQLESENIVTVIGRVRCSYISGGETITLPDKTGVLQLYIKPDEELAGFDVSVNIDVKKCGDGICSSLESLIDCQQDCVF